MAIAPIPVPVELHALEAVYAKAGHKMWLVGGCVRDHIMGLAAKDIDLATTATPDEQIALCDAAGYRWFGTGLQHGTITVLAGGEPYEITTLRTDVSCDGRHAEVEWASDIVVDLERRDLTINAIAMTLAGEIIDPFGGVEDCHARRVRFVGNAVQRIREDRLRILRWFRFLGRFGTTARYEASDLDAIAATCMMLPVISVERIWSEMQRIITAPSPSSIIAMMHEAGVLKALGLSQGYLSTLDDAAASSSSPAFVLAAWQGAQAPVILIKWKGSRDERETATFVASRLAANYDLTAAKRDLVEGADKATVLSLLRTRYWSAQAAVLEGWDIPTFPVHGRDLIAAGMTQGKALGQRLAAMRAQWVASDYTLGYNQLMLVEA
jgi:hypothetical protein